MSQTALWQVMRMFKFPDVDLLDQTYEGTTGRYMKAPPWSSVDTTTPSLIQRVQVRVPNA